MKSNILIPIKNYTFHLDLDFLDTKKLQLKWNLSQFTLKIVTTHAELFDTSFRSMDLLTSHCTAVQLENLSFLSKHNFLFSPTSYKSDGRLQCCVLRIRKRVSFETRQLSLCLWMVWNLQCVVRLVEVIIGWMTLVAKVFTWLWDSDYTMWAKVT